jgi:hypothetical protein
MKTAGILGGAAAIGSPLLGQEDDIPEEFRCQGTIQMMDGIPVNFEHLMKHSEWVFWPDPEELITCNSFRGCHAFLEEKDAVWKLDFDSKWVDDKWVKVPPEDRKWRKFCGHVQLMQHNGCRSYKHRFSISPMKIDAAPTVYLETQPFDFFDEKDWTATRDLEGRSRVYLPYGYDPHSGKRFEYQWNLDESDGAERLRALCQPSPEHMYKNAWAIYDIFNTKDLPPGTARQQVAALPSYEKWMKV